MAEVSSRCPWLPGQGGLDVGSTMGLRGEQADNKREARDPPTSPCPAVSGEA
jgi:hypothetical protein